MGATTVAFAPPARCSSTPSHPIHAIRSLTYNDVITKILEGPASRHARLGNRGCMVREQQQTNYESWIGELIQYITNAVIKHQASLLSYSF